MLKFLCIFGIRKNIFTTTESGRELRLRNAWLKKILSGLMVSFGEGRINKKCGNELAEEGGEIKK